MFLDVARTDLEHPQSKIVIFQLQVIARKCLFRHHNFLRRNTPYRCLGQDMHDKNQADGKSITHGMETMVKWLDTMNNGMGQEGIDSVHFFLRLIN